MGIKTADTVELADLEHVSQSSLVFQAVLISFWLPMCITIYRSQSTLASIPWAISSNPPLSPSARSILILKELCVRCSTFNSEELLWNSMFECQVEHLYRKRVWIVLWGSLGVSPAILWWSGNRKRKYDYAREDEGADMTWKSRNVSHFSRDIDKRC